MRGMRWLMAGTLLLTMEVCAAGDVRLRVASMPADSFVQSLAARVAGLQWATGEAPATARLVFDQLPESGELPVFAVRVPYRDLVSAGDCGCTGVAAEPDPADQLWLLRRLLPQARRVGVVLHPDNDWQKERLDKAAQTLTLALRYRELDDAEQMSEALADILPRVDALMLMPDSRLFNADTAKLILLTSYRQDRPVVGPNQGFVTAGSLASVHVLEPDMVETLANLIHRWLGNGDLPAPRFAEGTVAVNEHVARSYGVLLPEDLQSLQQELEVRP